MRKLLVTGPALEDPGGVSNYYRAMLPALRRQANLEVSYHPIGSSFRSGTSLLGLIREQLAFHRRISRERPSLVQLNPSLNFKSFARDSLFALATRAAGIPFVVFMHGWNEAHAATIERRMRWVYRLGLGGARTTIVLSDAIREQLQRWAPTSTVIRDTTVLADDALDGFSIERRVAGLQRSQELKVLFLSRLEDTKGIFETISAVRALAEEGLEISLTIAGSGAAEAEARALANGCTAIRFAGYLTGAAKSHAFCEHHVYCFPTYYGEGMPVSLVEAFAFGMPVITCRAGGIGDVFVDGRMGTMVQPRNSHTVAEALRAMAKNREKLSTVARHNHAFAKRHLLASAGAERLMGVYQALPEANGHP